MRKIKNKENEFILSIKNNTINNSQKKKYIYLLVLLFIIGWIVNAPDYTNFYSSIPAIVNLITYFFVILVPLWSLLIYNKKNWGENISYENYLYICGFIISKMLLSYSAIIFVYVVIFTMLVEFFDIYLYELRFYLVNLVTIIYSIYFLVKFNKIINKILE